MKIVILIKSYFKYNPGGSEHQALLFAKEMVIKGNEVHYIFVNSSNMKVPAIDEGINLHPLNPIKGNIMIGKPVFLYKKKVIKLLEEIRPEVIYHRNLNPFIGFACFYARSRKCKVIWHIASLNDVKKIKIKYKWSPIVSYFNNKWIKFGINYADQIITQEEKHDILLLKNFGKSNTVKINKFFPVLKNKSKSISKIKIFWIANIRPIKQLEIFLDLADKIDNNNIEFILF